MIRVNIAHILIYLVAAISGGNAASSEQAIPTNELAKIYYSGEMKTAAISQLASIVDEINKNNAIKRIYLYINSYGGDMDAGIMASAVIKSSSIPFTTVAMSTVGSSATIMLCATEDRHALPDGYIYLHPASIQYNGYVRPDNIQAMNKESQRFNRLFKKTYAVCTNLPEEKIDDILFSESNRITYTAEEAKKMHIISVIDSKIVSAKQNYYITAHGTGE